MSECIYCGNGNRKKKNGLYRIHPHCLLEMQEFSQSIDGVTAFLKGYRPRNENDYPTVEAYLKGLHEFSERCRRIAAITASVVTENMEEQKEDKTLG